MDTVDKVFALRKTEIFSRIPAELLISVAEECELVEYSAGEKVYGVGDEPLKLFILLSGEVEISSKDKVIRTLHEYDFYGLFTLFGDVPSTVDITVKQNSVQLILTDPVLEQLVDDYPDILREIARYMARLYLKAVGQDVVDGVESKI